MTWTHIRPNSGMGLGEQWILRAQCAPVCSLKRDPEAAQGAWIASLLRVGGISATVLHVADCTLGQAQARCEMELTRMGWELGHASPLPS